MRFRDLVELSPIEVHSAVDGTEIDLDVVYRPGLEIDIVMMGTLHAVAIMNEVCPFDGEEP